VIGLLIWANHARGHVLDAAPLDPSRGPLPDRVRVQQQRHHHRRIVRRPPVTVGAISGVERGQIHLRDRVDHKPREVIVGQPFAQARRQQQLLLAITRHEVLRHAGMAFLETGAFVGLVVPGETVVVVGGVAASDGDVSLPLIGLVAWIGAWVGDARRQACRGGPADPALTPGSA
jgi:hypothetical protein